MPISFFGFEIARKTPSEKEQELRDQPKSFVPPTADDGSMSVAAGGYFGQYLDIDGDSAKSDSDLIRKYRICAEQPECDSAIDDIINEAIISDDNESAVAIVLDDLKQPEHIKEKIREEFERVLELLSFSFAGHEVFRRWYIDGRLYYHMVVDDKDKSQGIQELRAVDALRIRKVREIKEETDIKTGAKIIKTVDEYFLYQEGGLQRSDIGLKINKDAVCYVPSGILDATRKRVMSPLHKAIKPVNQLRMMEDALVIYRLARAPERRIFYIDVGNLPKGKAEEYLKGIMNHYRNKLVYDANTGDIRDDRKFMSILEDFWLPRREGGRGTEITTLPGGENLGEIEDILFFQKKLYHCLNVPISRLESNTGFSLGRATEITRDELKFQKFIDRLRKRFSMLFLDLLRTQLILKQIINEDEWIDFKEKIRIDYRKDSHFTELKENEILAERLNVATQIGPFIGKYYSDEWVRKNVLKQDDAMIAEINAQIRGEVGGVIANVIDVTTEVGKVAGVTDVAGEVGKVGGVVDVAALGDAVTGVHDLGPVLKSRTEQSKTILRKSRGKTTGRQVLL